MSLLSPATGRAVALLAIACLLASVGCGPGGQGSANAAAPTSTTATSRPALTKVTVAGDSISIGLGAELRKVVGSGVDLKVIGEEGTGLARADTFDWPTRLQQLAREFPPAVLVLSLGSNDAQDLSDGTGKVVVPFSDQARWDAEYSRRLAASIDAFAATNTTVVWVGHVRTAEEKVATTNRRVHRLATAVAASRSFVRVADLAELLGTGEQKATRCLVPDGLHLSTTCLAEAATKLSAQLPR